MLLTKKTPYKEPSDDWLQIFASLQLLLTLLGGLILKTTGNDPDAQYYENTFMTYTLIGINGAVFMIGFCTMAFQNTLYIGIGQLLSLYWKRWKKRSTTKIEPTKNTNRNNTSITINNAT